MLLRLVFWRLPVKAVDSALKYCVFSTNVIHALCWGDQCAVYHTESGDTHLLNKVDLNVLQRLDETPVSAKDLALEFERVFDDGAAQYIQTLLSNLAALGLIETVDHEIAN